SSLELANSHSLKTIAFPAISCGVFGYPLDEAAKVSLTAARDKAGSLEEVHFVLFERSVWDAFLDFATTTFERPVQPDKQGTTGEEPSANEEEAGEMGETSDTGQGAVAADIGGGTSEEPSSQGARELEGALGTEMETDGDKKSTVAENTDSGMNARAQDAVKEELPAEKDGGKDGPSGDGIHSSTKEEDDPMQGVCVQDSANEAMPDEVDVAKGDKMQENIQDSANEAFVDRDGDTSHPMQASKSHTGASTGKGNSGAGAHPKDDNVVVLDKAGAMGAATCEEEVCEDESSKEASNVNVDLRVTENGNVNVNCECGQPLKEECVPDSGEAAGKDGLTKRED
ncbi:unnamed protein product, partial [Ostreobium quekettii]